jgi:hypothetical protein
MKKVYVVVFDSRHGMSVDVRESMESARKALLSALVNDSDFLEFVCKYAEIDDIGEDTDKAADYINDSNMDELIREYANEPCCEDYYYIIESELNP